tara:strand:+ start:784 stop:1197 length:414 start_codon:yes stop_codon:yes gene_type:complete
MDWKNHDQVSEYVELLNEKLSVTPWTIQLIPKSIQDGGKLSDITDDYEWTPDDIVVPDSLSGVTLPTVTDSEITTRITNKMWDSVRRKRNQALLNSDVFALQDRVMTDEQKAYRKALRDLPATQSDPFNITWPTKPS